MDKTVKLVRADYDQKADSALQELDTFLARLGDYAKLSDSTVPIVEVNGQAGVPVGVISMATGVPHDYITTMACDREGDIIETPGAGLWLIKLTALPFLLRQLHSSKVCQTEGRPDDIADLLDAAEDYLRSVIDLAAVPVWDPM